jgi:AraC-like DNA-binding protein
MAVVIDSDAVPEHERVAYWTDQLARTFFNPIRVQPADRAGFRRRLLAHTLGPVQVFRLAGGPSAMSRTPETIAAFDPEYLSLAIQVRGRCWQGQGQQMSQLAPGDAASHDSSRPYAVRVDGPFELLIFAFPKALLRPHVDRVCSKAGVRIPGDSGAASVAVPFLQRVGDALDDGLIADGDVNVGESVLHLIKALYLARRAPATATPARRAPEEIMAQVRASIDARLGDPDLTPDAIARANFVSTSYLHKLFQRHEGTSVGAWVRAARLRRCRRDLMDPSLADRRIIEIAADWGFQTPSHFSRAFREEFGCSPRDVRRALGRDAAR